MLGQLSSHSVAHPWGQLQLSSHILVGLLRATVRKRLVAQKIFYQIQCNDGNRLDTGEGLYKMLFVKYQKGKLSKEHHLSVKNGERRIQERIQKSGQIIK